MKKVGFLTQNDLDKYVEANKLLDRSDFSVIDKETERDLTILILSELRKVSDNNRSLIILCNGFFELVINHLVKKKLKTHKKIKNDNRTFSYSVKLTLLYEAGFLNEEEFIKLNYLRKIRNDLAHSPFSNLEGYDLKKLSSIGGDTYFILVFLISEIWNRHSVLLIDLNK